MIFQRRFHSHTPTSIDSPPTPPPKDGPSPPKTLEEILAIAVSPRAPKPPPHAFGTVASKFRIAKDVPIRSASSPLKSTVPKRAPSSRKTGHATIHTEGVNGQDSFESDAFAVHMPTTRIPIIDAPVARNKPASPTRAQVEAVQTYREKAQQARQRNDTVGVRVPPNIASYDYAYAGTSTVNTAIPASLKPSGSPPSPARAFPITGSTPQLARAQPEPRAIHTTTSKISSNTSVYRKPTVLGVTTAAAVIEESVHFVRADSKGGASRPTTPPKSTIVKISMKPKTPSPVKAPGRFPVIPSIKVSPSQTEAHQATAEHRRGNYYRAPHVASATPSRSPSPTKTMPNFTRQYSIEGDSIFGYKIKDPQGTVAGAAKSVSSSSDDEKPHPTPSKPQSSAQPSSSQKRTLTDRWPWIRKGATVGKPPSAPAPDPPVKAKAKAKAVVERPAASRYVSPFDTLESSAPAHPTPLRASPAVAALKKAPIGPRNESPTLPSPFPPSLDAGLQQVQAGFLLGLKIGLALYIVVSLWFVLDAVREALCAIFVPLQLVLVLAWAVVRFVGGALGTLAAALGGRIRVLGR